MTPRQIGRRLDRAKVFFDLGTSAEFSERAGIRGEPMTTPDWILFRELGLVLEEHFGKSEGEAVELIWQALRKGTLTAQTCGGGTSGGMPIPLGTMIPPSSWPEKLGGQGEINNWYLGRIWMNACAGFREALPGLPRKAVVAWLLSLTSATTSPGRPRKVELVAKAYEKRYPSGHDGLSLTTVAEEIGRIVGFTVSERTLRRARSDLKPV